MPGLYKERTCPNCGKIKRMHPDQLCCSQTCASELARKDKINRWLLGEEIKTSRGKTSTARWIRDYMLEQSNFKCSKCNWGETNLFTGKIPLELEHKDGNFMNNKIDNLEVLCPNCHALTATYKEANKSAGRPRAKYYRGT